MTLLRQYEPRECVFEGYPWAWAHGTTSGSGSARDPLRSYKPIKDYIREQADYRCLRCGHPYPPGIAETHPRGEWTPCDERCTHPFGTSRGIDGGDQYAYVDGVLVAKWRILTVHHLDEDKANCRWWNLAALCQRCHLRMQRAVVMDRVYHFEHSEWFKPYAAGFYAWKYENEDLTREETMQRMDYYLGYEHRFTQEALL